MSTIILTIFILSVVELMCAAHRYDLPDLMEICRNFLDSCTSTCAIYTVLDTAQRLQGQTIAQKIAQKVQLNISEFETEFNLKESIAHKIPCTCITLFSNEYFFLSDVGTINSTGIKEKANVQPGELGLKMEYEVVV